MTEPGSPRLVELWKAQLAELEFKAQHLMPNSNEIREGLNIARFETRDRYHIPLLRELLQAYRMDGAGWREQF